MMEIVKDNSNYDRKLYLYLILTILCMIGIIAMMYSKPKRREISREEKCAKAECSKCKENSCFCE